MEWFKDMASRYFRPEEQKKLDRSRQAPQTALSSQGRALRKVESSMTL